MTRRRIEQIWPDSWNSLSEVELQHLDDTTFIEFRRRIYERELKNSGSIRRAREISRKLTRKRKIVSRGKVPSRLLLGKKKDSTILSTFCPQRDTRWLNPVRRRKSFELSLENFSFIDDPIKTIQSLHYLSDAECWAADALVHFDDDHIYDIGAFLVLGLMTEGMLPYMSGGRIHRSAQAVIEVVELRQFLHMKKFHDLKKIKDVWGFQLRRRRPAGTSKSDNLATSQTTKEKVADSLVDSINEWLDQLAEPMVLSDIGMHWLSSIVGEILDNAERHSQIYGDGDWATAGFMAKRAGESAPDSGSRYMCHLAFVNVGRTISDSVMDSYSELETAIQKYADKHRSGGKGGLSRESLAAVYALQDGISRVPQDADVSKGGVGMMDIIQFVNQLSEDGSHEVTPEVAILSGSSCIVFREPYHAFAEKGGDERRLQWFNPSCDHNIRPDDRHVFTLPHRFPGTIITMRFCLGEEAVAEGEDDNG